MRLRCGVDRWQGEVGTLHPESRVVTMAGRGQKRRLVVVNEMCWRAIRFGVELVGRLISWVHDGWVALEQRTVRRSAPSRSDLWWRGENRWRSK
jgi:hypothetical protein